MNTEEQFRAVMKECREVFVKKLHDYGAAWRILRIPSLTDQLYIKANRIRSLEMKGESKVGEGIRPEFIAIVNYSIIGLIQLEHGIAEKPDDMTTEAAIAEPYAAARAFLTGDGTRLAELRRALHTIDERSFELFMREVS